MSRVKELATLLNWKPVTRTPLHQVINTTRTEKIICVYSEVERQEGGIQRPMWYMTLIGINGLEFTPDALCPTTDKAMVDAAADMWHRLLGWPIKRVGCVRR